MATDLKNELTDEWLVLHRDHERYEQCALIIKLLSVVICTFCLIFTVHFITASLLLLTLWLQEGIWKTYQQRLSTRIIALEQGIKNAQNENDNSVSSFELYSSFEDNRPSGKALLKEYILNALRPTVVYPYVILILIGLL